MRLVNSGKYRPTARSVVVLATLLMMFLHPLLAFGQKPEYEFYFEFRTVFMPKVQEENHWSLTNEQVYEKYAAKLKSDRIAESEIARRLRLLRAEHAVLEADFYSRYYLDSSSNFNHAPNTFLMEVVKGMQPGSALDYGMGQGRNSIYLASLGWDVWGFDPADAGIAIAQRRAKELGLTLHTSAVRDSEYDFGKERFDLILFSWTKPLVPVQKVVDSLKPGGIVVMECGQEFVPEQNSILHLFDSLLITRTRLFGLRQTGEIEGRWMSFGWWRENLRHAAMLLVGVPSPLHSQQPKSKAADKSVRPTQSVYANELTVLAWLLARPGAAES